METTYYEKMNTVVSIIETASQETLRGILIAMLNNGTSISEIYDAAESTEKSVVAAGIRIPYPLFKEVRGYINGQQQIQAIKHLRQNHHDSLTLLEAKRACDEIRDTYTLQLQ